MALKFKDIPDSSIMSISHSINVDYSTSVIIIEKAVAGGEINDLSELDSWIKERLIPNCVFIEED